MYNVCLQHAHEIPVLEEGIPRLAGGSRFDLLIFCVTNGNVYPNL